MRRVRHPDLRAAGQRVDHGAAHHARRRQARVGQAHHRRRAVLPLLPPGQEGPRARADQRPPDRRPHEDRRRRPRDERRPARRPDPGLLRRPRRPPVRQAGAAGVLRAQAHRGPRAAHGGLARHGPRAGRRQLVRQARRSAGDHPQAPRPERGEPGHGARDRRPGRRPGLPARRRHDRHRRHDREGRGGPQAQRRERVIVAATHADLQRPGRRRAWTTTRSTRSSSPTRCPSRRSKRFPALTVLPIAPLLARAIYEVFEDGSVTSMFDGAA